MQNYEKRLKPASWKRSHIGSFRFPEQLEAVGKHTPDLTVGIEGRGACRDEKGAVLNGVTVEDIVVGAGNNRTLKLDDMESRTVAEGAGIDNLGARRQRNLSQRVATEKRLVANVVEPFRHDDLGDVAAVGKSLSGDGSHLIVLAVGTYDAVGDDDAASGGRVDSRLPILVGSEAYMAGIRPCAPHLVAGGNRLAVDQHRAVDYVALVDDDLLRVCTEEERYRQYKEQETFHAAI